MRIIATILLVLSLSACSNWIYRIDIPQGNYLDQKDVNKLRVDMTKAQVEFVLGQPVVADSFDRDTWYYVYDMKRGMTHRGDNVRNELILRFKDGKLVSLDGDFEQPEDFNTPLDS